MNAVGEEGTLAPALRRMWDGRPLPIVTTLPRNCTGVPLCAMARAEPALVRSRSPLVGAAWSREFALGAILISALLMLSITSWFDLPVQAALLTTATRRSLRLDGTT